MDFSALLNKMLVFLVIMVIGYTLGRAYVYSTPEYAVLKLPFEILQAGVGAVLSVLLVYPMGLKKVFERTVRAH